MKTAISIPDEVFEAAERTAKAPGVSRSEFYATAVREDLERGYPPDKQEQATRTVLQQAEELSEVWTAT
jgi:metal-responsive CopG/Arc/MetJ family transcriptional regulator